MTAICWLALVLTHDFLLYEITSVGFGFCAAGWLHLVMDIMTPSGIPLVTPFGSRFSFNLYKTSQLGEWLCILLFVVGCQFFSLLPRKRKKIPFTICIIFKAWKMDSTFSHSGENQCHFLQAFTRILVSSAFVRRVRDGCFNCICKLRFRV
ncbi:metal-dependent hydrolase [Methylobacter tundripaludum]|uniref:metal-dependent hydrolase n=1 Tax=Methylobacter tundripaludum TaxID=173365 RepID=UPI0009DFAE87